MRILVVEDEELVRRMLGKALTMNGFDFLPAEDGVAALAALHTALEMHLEIDGILLDLNMPRMSGQEFMKRLKEDFRLSSIPVIVVTGHPEGAVEEQIDGPVATIRKPLEIATLIATIKRTCGARV